MASDISIGEQYLWVANRRLSSLIAFVLEVASDDAGTDEEKGYVAKLKKWDETEHWPGCGFDLHERFPTVDEKQFWSRCFFNVARRIFRHEIGNQDIQFWQCGAIGDAYVTARMLTSAIQKETGTSWFPDTEDAADAQEYYDRLNIQT
ncbi:MAG: hypothetical protein GY748_19365 [Planctomycetaceae bacterium]|jgi:hypothetical protein|nr:hypothetical protein [Planctomycetaceae bacterium]MCP4499938.1 hypothetical protein [Deltaproteobacteria bacterium]MCP4785153.1 hypothetical protein [Fuerstiella sp.]